jgi:hypothetical protein
MDEYHSELMMGGRNTISMHTVCEDSLLASPLIIDLVVIAEFFSRVQYRTSSDEEFRGFHSVMSILSYWLKAPLSRPGREAVNGLGKQRAALENILRALLGLAPNNEMKYVPLVVCANDQARREMLVINMLTRFLLSFSFLSFLFLLNNTPENPKIL